MSYEKHYRYAVYFTPALNSPWYMAGSQWLGRCAASGEMVQQPSFADLSAERLFDLTQEPRRYGWHATLKAPFELMPNESLGSLRQALQEVAQDFDCFELPTLQLSTRGGFLALRPALPSPALKEVAAACVTRLQALAKPLSPADLARRRKAQLTPAQDELLMKWGYPWVLDEFYFHLSLTGSLAGSSSEEVERLTQAAQSHFGAMPPIKFEALSLFAEPYKGAPFQWLESVGLSS